MHQHHGQRSPGSVEYIEAPTRDDLQQKQLAKSCFWEAFDQVLWVDARALYPELGVIKLLSWEAILMDGQPIPKYPSFLKPLSWPRVSEVAAWSKLIPKWVAESCQLFPSHQLTLLHYVGKYPQLLELLDHAPYLAWRLVSSNLQEPEIVALLSGKRQQIVEQLGWPGVKETLKFLQNLRLRQVTPMIIDQVETCALDPSRLSALQTLPRINSMALTLASRFPEMIGCRLHLSLAKQPCQPMQCQTMVALLEDVFRLVKQLELGNPAIEKIRQCLFLSEVHQLALQWMRESLVQHPLMKRLSTGLKARNLQTQWQQLVNENIDSFIEVIGLGFSSTTPTQSAQPINPTNLTKPMALTKLEDWQTLSLLQEHAWWLEFGTGKQLYVWQESLPETKAPAGKVASPSHMQRHNAVSHTESKPSLWAALVDTQPLSPQQPPSILRMRGLENRLPQSKQLSDMHLFLLQQVPKRTE